MFHISRTIAFTVCVAVMVFVNWYAGVGLLILALVFIPKNSTALPRTYIPKKESK